MYCQNCGKEFADDYSSCPWCGFPVPEEIHRAVEDIKGDELSLRSAVRLVAKENATYFMNESNKINYAASFGPAYCLYRKCYDVFAKRFLIPIILIITGVILLEVFDVLSISLLAIAVGSLWRLISSFWMVIRFNDMYRKRCCEVAAAGDTKKYGTSKVSVALYVAAIIAIVVAFTILPEVLPDDFSASHSGTYVDDGYGAGNNEDPLVETVYNGYLGEYTDAPVGEMLEWYYVDMLGYTSAEWSSGIAEDNTVIVEATFCSSEFGNEFEFKDAMIQFAMLDSECFKVVYAEDPIWDVNVYADVFVLMNSIYCNYYQGQHPSDEDYYKLLERIDTQVASVAAYGASKDYTGNRSTIYTKDDEALVDADEFYWSVSTLFSYYE